MTNRGLFLDDERPIHLVYQNRISKFSEWDTVKSPREFIKKLDDAIASNQMYEVISFDYWLDPRSTVTGMDMLQRMLMVVHESGLPMPDSLFHTRDAENAKRMQKVYEDYISKFNIEVKKVVL